MFLLYWEFIAVHEKGTIHCAWTQQYSWLDLSAWEKTDDDFIGDFKLLT